MAIPIERKNQILEDAKQLILDGWTLYQIAEKHGISSRTLSTWLHSLGDEYVELRRVWIDNMLLEASDSIDNALEADIDQEGINQDRARIDRANIQLAHAREKWKKATWYAERRDSQRYGQKSETKQDLAISITVNRGQNTRVIEGITDELRKLPSNPLILGDSDPT